MLKKIVSLVVGATLVLATLGVSAATVGTVSEYEGDNIKVTTTVQQTSAGDVYTYLAYKKGANIDNLQNQEVVYVDEKSPTTAGENVVFEYTTAAANDEAVILVGGVEDNPVQNVIDPADPTVLKEVKVQVDAGAESTVSVNVTNATDSTLVLVPVEGLSEVVISGVQLNDVAFEDYTAAADGLYVPYSAIKGEDAYKFVISTMTGAVASAVTIWNGAYVAAEDGVIAVAQVKGSSNNFGITFSDGSGNSFDADAKGVGTYGLYAIRLNNIANSMFKDAATIFAQAYADEVVSEDTLEIVVKAPVAE